MMSTKKLPPANFEFPTSNAFFAMALASEVRISKAAKSVTRPNLNDEDRAKIVAMEKHLASLTKETLGKLNEIFEQAGIDKTTIELKEM